MTGCPRLLDTEDCCDDVCDAQENFAEHDSGDDEKNMKRQESKRIVSDCHGRVFLLGAVFKHLVRKFTCKDISLI